MTATSQGSGAAASATAVPMSEPLSQRGDLRAILAPRSIAVIGASRRPGTMGHQILQNLMQQGFTGVVYPVNPQAAAICGVRAYATVAEIPDPVDLAVIVVPKGLVCDVAEQCGRAGVKGLVVISAGFREVGGEGVERERRLVEIVQQFCMRMVGPNCMGVLNADPSVSMNATFSTIMPPFGHAAFVSQSGALGLSVLDYAQEYGIGISQFVSMGNKPDVSGNDLLLEWERDPGIRVILMYVENFGNPRRFLEIASRVTRTKPIIVVKSGRSAAGAKAASSHTGALAANDRAVDALLVQAGVLRAETIEELFDMAMAFGARALPKSRRTAVLTNSGGPGILAADAMEACGLRLAELSPTTVATLRAILPAEASIRNPLDMVASANPASYRTAMRALLDDPGVDAIVPIFVPPFGLRQEDVAAAIVDAAASRPTVPIVAVLMGREGLPAGRAELQAAGIPAYIFPEAAARALLALNRQAEWMARPATNDPPLDALNPEAARGILERARKDSREALTEIEAIDLLRAYGVPVAPIRIATSEEEAVKIAATLGYPLVMKITSPDIVHKTDAGGVQVGIDSERALRTAYAAMLARVHTRVPDARLDGVLLQPMATPGRETIVGISRDPGFGPLIMFGLGGIFVEAFHDVTFRLAPVTLAEARDMVHGIRGVKVLAAIRGEPPVDEDALVDAIRRVARLASDFPEIAELDVNPLLASAAGIVAVDARVRLTKR